MVNDEQRLGIDGAGLGNGVFTEHFDGETAAVGHANSGHGTGRHVGDELGRDEDDEEKEMKSK